MSCLEALARRVTLAYRDAKKRICVYTDASDSFGSGMTQVPTAHTSLPHAEQS